MAPVVGSYGSTPQPIPRFQHPSHELLQDNGFTQQLYSKYRSKCLKGLSKMNNLCVFAICIATSAPTTCSALSTKKLADICCCLVIILLSLQNFSLLLKSLLFWDNSYIQYMILAVESMTLTTALLVVEAINSIPIRNQVICCNCFVVKLTVTFHLSCREKEGRNWSVTRDEHNVQILVILPEIPF